MRWRLAIALGVAAIAAGVVTACADDTIVLARIDGADGGGAAGGTGTRCSGNGECAAGSFCQKNACSDPAGTCTPLPLDCGPDDGPHVCGCDGVMYFNDCLRRQWGVASTLGAQCPLDVAQFCGPSTPCDGGALCARVYGGSPSPDCPHDVPGYCWVIPDRCVPDQGSTRFDECGPQGAQCVDSCQAIASGLPFHPARRSECP